MADTIREQIISAYMTRLAAWTTANGFNIGCGGTILRAVQNVDPDTLPACVLHPRMEEATQRYGMNVCEMVLRVEAMTGIEQINPSVVQEKLLGDTIKIMTDPTASITSLHESIVYTTGGPASVPVGEDTIIAVFAEFTVRYSTVCGNPYSQTLPD